MIFAQTEPGCGRKGLGCFLVPTDSEGFSTQEIHGKLGLQASDTASIALDGVEVGDDAMMGEIGEGFKVAMSALDSGRYSVAAGCVGICEGCVDASVSYSTERQQFGVPLARFQLVQELIADMVVKRDAARMLVLRAGILKDGASRRRSRPRSRSSTPPNRRWSAQTPRSRFTGGPAMSTTTRSSVPARRPRDNPLRGHIADPEADHRADATGVSGLPPIRLAMMAPVEEDPGRQGRAPATEPSPGAQRPLTRADGRARRGARAAPPDPDARAS